MIRNVTWETQLRASLGRAQRTESICCMDHLERSADTPLVSMYVFLVTARIQVTNEYILAREAIEGVPNIIRSSPRGLR
jgi:hypothetical protein